MVQASSRNKSVLQRFPRFTATICSLLTIGLFGFVSNAVYEYDDATGCLMALTVAIFTYNWYNLHGNGLTRARRPFLNIANVLDTYQVYNRKYGQFYEHDPDTPGDAAQTFRKAAEASLGDIFKDTGPTTIDDRTRFEEAVRRHYAELKEAVQRSERDFSEKLPTNEDIDTKSRTSELQEANIPLTGLPNDSATEKKPSETEPK